MGTDTSDLLHVSSTGTGPDLVLVHGWGMHSGIWRNLLEPLQQDYRLHRVDLPGHGQSRTAPGEFDLARLADLIWHSVAGRLGGPAVWLGWSLGGLAAMQIALQHPGQVRALILVASTPRFVQASDWSQAMPPPFLETFADQLADDYEGTLQRFLALQVKDSEDAREALRRLRRQVLDGTELDPAALRSGLAILQQADLRDRLLQLGNLPVLQIFGGRDMLVPPASAQAQAALFANCRQVVIEGAGHAPFVSHPELFLQQVVAFLNAAE